MKRENLKKTILGLAIAAATGVAFAQSPAAPATDRGAAGADKSSGSIVDRQTQPPRDAGTSTTPSDATSGQGAGASQRNSGQYIDRQTKPGGAAGGSASSGEPNSRTSDVTSGRIVDEQTKPGAGKMDPAQRGGTGTR
ncbi:MAG TPA: hypothetical protein PK177_23390 [Burkholderiaceae bacterium]|nr:hypothetical protein [Burkholderiaceae bacterium]